MEDDRVIIVGGGVIGLAIGWRLAQAGRDVTILERDQAGRGASWASAGMLTPLAEVRFEEEELLKLGLHALETFPTFIAELESDTGLEVDYREDGVLMVGITQDDVSYLRFRYDYQNDLGLPVEWLTGREARNCEPMLSGRVSAAVWCPGDHQIDNRKLIVALEAAFRKHGGVLKEQTLVVGVEIRGSKVLGVRVKGELLQSDIVVLAAGSWSGRIPGLPEDACPPVRPVKGQILRMQMNEGWTLHRIVWYTRTESSTLAYLAPKGDGTLVLGATSEEMGFDTKLTAGGIFELLRAGSEAVPGIYDLPIIESGAGLRPGSRDDGPILGKTPIEGLLVATGHFRKGILLAPITANTITELVMTGETPEVIRSFGMDRFLKPAGTA